MRAMSDVRGIFRPCMTFSMPLVFLCLCSSCSSFNVTVRDPELPTAQTATIPAEVGIYFAPEFHHSEVDSQLMADYGFRLRTDLGPASVAMFESILTSSFPRSRHVDANALSSGKLVVLVPSVDFFEYSFGPETAQINAKVVYGVAVFRPGKEPLNLQFEGLLDSTDTPLSGSSIVYSAAPKYISQAMRNAGTKLVLLLHKAAETDDWLEELERYANAAE